MTSQELQAIIEAGLRCEHITLEGDGRHWYATIVSAEFEGKNRVARQRLVYEALKDEFAAGLHALALTTLTPGEDK